METYKLKSGKTLKVFVDESPFSPREDDNLSKMICFHKRYQLGDKHDYNHNDYNSWDELKDAIIENESPAVILPLYLYDHSGITISTSPFSCRWDSGQIGWVIVTEKQIKKEYNVSDISDELLNKVTTIALNEVETYDHYITGNVYGYELFDDKGNEVDSCYGFFGDDIKDNGILDNINEELAV